MDKAYPGPFHSRRQPVIPYEFCRR
ncbi:hypothetical protein [Streptococcus infantis]|nr:hypothetical protein [Streptococcus infantis]